ncbi:cysteine hydrolase family protein [Staphylococcus caledonicus]|uniref:cysteine hydrolase family protein n=1 Tax=Staphylococcus caledonicus TaxID=2741333 RepID=UPI0018E4BDFA|nr:cysteine hydrolase family protein [Staphylococcus caledonicus]MBI5973637.1 cysteine hydrolase [Staphylococcus caledonicus]
MKQRALLVIDIQNDYFEGGKYPLVNTNEALANILKLEKQFKQNNEPVIYIQHINYNDNATFFENNTTGVELKEELDTDSNSIIIEKQYPNSFLDTQLKNTLEHNNIEEVVICGMMTHMCVDSTTRAAAELGYQPTLIDDATATRDLEVNGNNANAEDVQNAFIAALTAFSTVKKTDEFVESN